MNERIKQLAEQAGVKMNAYGHPIPASLASNFDELAELIVKECIDVVGKATASPTGYQALMKHFGVEE